ncbi:MAG: hypothetical protein QNJ97_17980 [Myxococcota bacterium]|nr:hypothetical protein [Myxococcota bacterium]
MKLTARRQCARRYPTAQAAAAVAVLEEGPLDAAASNPGFGDYWVVRYRRDGYFLGYIEEEGVAARVAREAEREAVTREEYLTALRVGKGRFGGFNNRLESGDWDEAPGPGWERFNG